MDRRSPRDILPHGSAFLFVDEITEFEGRRLKAQHLVPLEEPWTAAHFPGNPIVPGVLILEGMVQTCGILTRLFLEKRGNVHLHFGTLASVKSARFLQLVRPGSLLTYEATLEVNAASIYSFKVITTTGEVIVAKAEVYLSLT